MWKKEGEPRIQGYLTYNTETKESTVEPAKVNNWLELSPALSALVFRGLSKISGDEALNWVRNRIIPACRPEIPDVLRAAGLDRYDEFELLLFAKGRNVRDLLYLEEVDEFPPHGLEQWL